MVNKKGLGKSAIVPISIIVILALLFFLLIRSERSNQMHEKYQIEQSRKNTVDVARENKELLDSLAKRLYSQEVEIFVDYSDGQIQYEENVNGKKWESKSMDSDMESLLLILFDSLECESIVVLYEEDYGKILKIYMDDIRVFGRNIGSKSLIYCENKSEYLHDEILPNWYYEPVFNV